MAAEIHVDELSIRWQDNQVPASVSAACIILTIVRWEKHERPRWSGGDRVGDAHVGAALVLTQATSRSRRVAYIIVRIGLEEEAPGR